MSHSLSQGRRGPKAKRLQVAEDSHKTRNLACRGILAWFEIVLNAQPGKKDQDHLRDKLGVHFRLFCLDVLYEKTFESCPTLRHDCMRLNWQDRKLTHR